MQNGPSGGAVRVVIASDAPQAVAELDKLAGYADQVCLVGFIRRADELDEDLEALQPDLILLYTGFGGLDTVSLAANLASRSALLRVMVVVDPADEPFIARLEDVGAATVPSDASPVALVTAIRGAAATSPPPPALSAPPAASWPEVDATLLSPPPAGTEPPPGMPASEAPERAGQSPAVSPGGITAWPERLPGAGPTGTTMRTEPGPAAVTFPSSVPVFQLDTAAFEPPPHRQPRVRTGVARRPRGARGRAASRRAGAGAHPAAAPATGPATDSWPRRAGSGLLGEGRGG